MAISPTRVEPRASNRFATFDAGDQQHEPRRDAAGSSAASRALSSIGSARARRARARSSWRETRSIVCSLKPVSSGASTSLMIARYGTLIARGRLLERHAGLQAREQIGPVALAIVVVRERVRAAEPAERDRHEHLRAPPTRRAVEPARRDADDRQRLAVDDERRGRRRPDRRRTPTASRRSSARRRSPRRRRDRRSASSSRPTAGVRPSSGK